MSKLKKYLGEYFFGTETIKFYRNLRSFVKEFSNDDTANESKRVLRLSKIMQTLELTFCRYTQNILDIGAVTYTAVTRDPLPLAVLGFSELTRISAIYFTNRLKTHSKKTLERVLGTAREVQQFEEDI